MKAKEYALRYVQSGQQIEQQAEIVKMMLDEMNALLKTRHVSTDAGFVAVYLETCNKFHAMCNILEKMNAADKHLRIRLFDREMFDKWFKILFKDLDVLIRAELIREKGFADARRSRKTGRM